MAKSRKKLDLGVLLKPTTEVTTKEGELRVSDANELKVYLNSSEREVVTENQTQTLTNKSIDADNNTISNLEVDNLKSGVLDTDLTSVSGSDDTIPSAKAVKAYVDLEVGDVGTDLSNHIADTSTHGVTGAIVGTTDTQTLSNKTYNGTLDTIIVDKALLVSPDSVSPISSPYDLDATSPIMRVNPDLNGGTLTLERITNTSITVTIVNSGSLENIIIPHLAGGAGEFRFADGLPLLLLPGQAATFAPGAGPYELVSLSTPEAKYLPYDNDDSGLSSINVKTALDELDSDITAHTGASQNVHGIGSGNSVVGTGTTQTLTNKNLNSGTNTFPNFSIAGDVTGTLSASSVVKIRNTDVPAPTAGDDGKALVYDHTSGDFIYAEAGSGSGEGGINYIENSRIEDDITGYNRYVDAAGSVPVDGTGGSPTANFTISRSTVSPLRGTGSLLLSKLAANTQGHGVSYDFTVDNADLAKKLTISFDYDTTVNYADGDIRVYIYDVTNAVVIRVNGEDLKAGSGTAYAQFQTASNSSSYRLIFHVATTKATAYGVKLDNIKVGPTNLAFGAIVTDWEQVATSNLGTISGLNIVARNEFVRRIGDSLEWHGDLNTTTTGATLGEIRVAIPSGYTVDTSNALSSYVGHCQVVDTSTSAVTGGSVFFNSAGYLIFTSTQTATAPTWNSSTNVPIGYDTSDFIRFKVTLPILGWSSNAQMSEDLGGREIVARVTQALSQSVADGLTNFKVGFTAAATIVYDTAALWNSSTLRYEINETGFYDLSGTINFGAGVDDTSNGGIQFIVNGTAFGGGNTLVGLAGGNTNTLAHSALIRLQKGDFVELFGYWNDITSTNSLTVSQGTFTIAKRSSPQTMLETETVAARYTTNAGQSIPVGDNTIVYEDLAYDTHGSYNTSTGQYTTPVSGVYQISGRATAVFNTVSGDLAAIHLSINGVLTSTSRIEFDGTNASNNTTLYVSDSVFLNKGDLVTIVVANTSGETVSLTATTRENTFSIARIK